MQGVRRGPLMTALLPLALAVPQVVAQSGGSRIALEEVIVTAQKREESLQDAPISITAFNENALEAQGITAIDDLQGKVPSLNLTPFPTQYTSLRLFIRGVGASDIQVTQDPAVGVYIDQIYIGRSTGLALELADLAQIEVLRGPQGTLFGRNSIGGAINMTTKKPVVGETEFKQLISVGDRSLFKSKTSGNIALGENLALRAVYLYKSQDGWVKNDGPGRDFLDGKDKGGKLDFLWEKDNFSARYAYDFARSEFVSPVSQAIEASDSPLAALTQVPVFPDRLDRLATKEPMLPSNTDIDGHALTLEYSFDNMTFKSITAFRDFEYFEFTNLESGSQSPSLVLSGNGAVNLTGTRNRLGQEQFSQEFQLLGDLNDNFNYVLGMYYFHESAEDTAARVSNVIVPQPTLRTRFEIENEAYALFAQGDWVPNILDNRLTITTGVRYTVDERVAQASVSNDPDPQNLSFDVKPDHDFDNISYTLVANYAATDEMNVYLKYATGYKAGGYNIRASNAASYVTGFDEEELVTWELGLKSEFFDRRMRLNGALYYTDYDDIQLNLADVSTPDDVRDTNVFNAGKAEIMGVELDVEALLTEGLTAKLSYAYQDADFKEVVDPNDPTLSAADFVFSNSPEHQYTLSMDYQRSLSVGEFSASVNYYWVDDRFDTQRTLEAESGQSLIDSYSLLDARVGVSDIAMGKLAGSLSVSLWGKNLADEDYFTAAPTILQPAGAYNKAVTWGEPRSYGVDVVYEFSK